MRVLLAAGLLLATSLAVQAEPWRLDRLRIEAGTFYSAVQFDADGDYALVVECHQETGDYQLFVESPYEWETGASYAPEVPAILTVDGVELSDVPFHFDDKQLMEGIRADTSAAGFRELLLRLANAGGEIRLNYFDRAATFSAEGAAEALFALDEGCR